MKFSSSHSEIAAVRAVPRRFARSGFTMIEIAICLAIIGVALVAIIGVLPLGMNVQRDNGQETVINQDATILLEAIRNGSLAQDDLTNYVYAITNFSATFPDGTLNPPVGWANFTNGAEIVGILSTPQYVHPYNLDPTNNLFNVGISNHIVAYVRSMSGNAVEKAPQNNPILREDTFGYHVYCVNEMMAFDTNRYASLGPYERQMEANLHEIRLRFLYPVRPSGKVGGYTLTYRTLAAGQIAMQTNFFESAVPFPRLYYYQPQNYTNAP